MKSKVTYHIEAFRSIEHSYTHLENIATAKMINNPPLKTFKFFSYVCICTNTYISKIKSM